MTPCSFHNKSLEFNEEDYITINKSSQDYIEFDDEELFMGFKERCSFEENCYEDQSDRWLEMSYNFFTHDLWDMEDEDDDESIW